jgi:hypothetical protein
MNGQLRQVKRCLCLFILASFSLACSSITITLDQGKPTAESVASGQQIGFDFSSRSPETPEGDLAASRHLFLHTYPMPDDGFITGVAYLNDSDMVSESFNLLILRPEDKGWKIIYRVDLSDDTPPAKTGITIISLPYPLSVQEDDLFAHWQAEVGGAIPLNTDDLSLDGFSIGQYGFRSEDLEIGQQIANDGFSGHRDYFINLIFTATP